MAENIPPDDNDGIPGIDWPLTDEGVGYGRPPKQHQFKKGQSGNPKGRPKKIITDQIQIAGLLEAPVTATVNGKKEKLQVFEVGQRKLAQRSIQERHLPSTIQLLKQAARLGLLQKPRRPDEAPTMELPNDWDAKEWIAMVNQHGLPPWPGPRDGLSKEDRERLMAPAFEAQAPIVTPAELKISRMQWSQRDVLRHLLLEQHASNEGGHRINRTTLELVMLVLKTHVASGNMTASRYWDSLLGAFATPPRTRRETPAIVIPERISAEEWMLKYHQGTEQERLEAAVEAKKMEEEYKNRNPSG